MNCDQSNPKLKSSLHFCSPPPPYSDFGWAGILSWNKCFIWYTPHHRKPQYSCRNTNILHAHIPVETLRSSITALSKRNLANDGCIEWFFFYQTDAFSTLCYIAFPTLFLQSFWRFIYVGVACPILKPSPPPSFLPENTSWQNNGFSFSSVKTSFPVIHSHKVFTHTCLNIRATAQVGLNTLPDLHTHFHKHLF